MPTRPLFSIIIPTLAKYDQWQCAITSALNQTFADFEIIAVDSGEETKGREVTESFKDSRIIYVNTSKGDPRLNWDTGFRRSQGQYIIWLEDDNYILPRQLEEMSQVIKTHNADLVTVNYLHYRGTRHPIKTIRNQLIIPGRLFTGKTFPLDRHEVLKNIFLTSARPNPIFRVGMAMTTIKREPLEPLLKKMGKIDFGTTGTHALRIGMLAMCKNYYFIDKPLCIGAQTGVSLSDVWPKPSSKINIPEFQYRLSEVTANTYNNYRHENHLLIKRALPEELAEYGDDDLFFFQTYREQLIYLDLHLKTYLGKWRELFGVIKNHKDKRVRGLYTGMKKLAIKGLIAQIIRSLGLYDFLKKIFAERRLSKKYKLVFSLDPYGVKNIHECAQKLVEVIKKEDPDILYYFIDPPGSN